MSFLLAGREHLNRGLIGVDDALGQHGIAQRINYRLELHTSLSNPLCQCRACNRQTGPTKKLLLPVQRQVVGKLRHHHMRQQACGRDALVDYLSRHRCLDQCFALPAGPLPTYVLLDREHARRVIELLADVFADALKLAATCALRALGVVTDHRAWKLRRQRRTFGLLTWFGRCSRRIDRLQLSFDGCDINVEQIVEQAALVRAQLLAALGEFVPFEHCDFIGELFVDCFDPMDLLAHRVDLR